jgi:hypothetical protein
MFVEPRRTQRRTLDQRNVATAPDHITRGEPPRSPTSYNIQLLPELGTCAIPQLWIKNRGVQDLNQNQRENLTRSRFRQSC